MVRRRGFLQPEHVVTARRHESAAGWAVVRAAQPLGPRFLARAASYGFRRCAPTHFHPPNPCSLTRDGYTRAQATLIYADFGAGLSTRARWTDFFASARSDTSGRCAQTRF